MVSVEATENKWDPWRTKHRNIMQYLAHKSYPDGMDRDAKRVIRRASSQYQLSGMYIFNCTMMTSPNGNIFRVTGRLCGEFTGDKGQRRGALMFSLIFAWVNDWVNNREAGDLRCHRAGYNITVMILLLAHSRKSYALTYVVPTWQKV